LERLFTQSASLSSHEESGGLLVKIRGVIINDCATTATSTLNSDGVKDTSVRTKAKDLTVKKTIRDTKTNS